MLCELIGESIEQSAKLIGEPIKGRVKRALRRALHGAKRESGLEAACARRVLSDANCETIRSLGLGAARASRSRKVCDFTSFPWCPKPLGSWHIQGFWALGLGPHGRAGRGRCATPRPSRCPGWRPPAPRASPGQGNARAHLHTGRRQCNAKCRFTGNFDRAPDQLCQLLDRLSDHLALHWVQGPGDVIGRG